MSQNFASPWKITPPTDLLEKTPHLNRLASQLSLKFVHEHVEEEDLKVVGSALWESLKIDEDFQKAYEQSGIQILPLLISLKNSSLMTLPWECLFFL